MFLYKLYILLIVMFLLQYCSIRKVELVSLISNVLSIFTERAVEGIFCKFEVVCGVGEILWMTASKRVAQMD